MRKRRGVERGRIAEGIGKPPSMALTFSWCMSLLLISNSQKQAVSDIFSELFVL